MYTDRATPSLYNIPSLDGKMKTKAGASTSVSANPIAKPATALHEISRAHLPSALLPRVPEDEPMPPALKPPAEKRYHVTAEQVAEMQELRRSDAGQWTIDRLAEKYGCSTLFVRIAAKNFEAGKAHFESLDGVKERWGRKKMLARRDRGRRKELWGRDA